MRLALFALVLSFVACRPQAPNTHMNYDLTSSPHAMSCEVVVGGSGIGVYRCINGEAVCYASSDGISCKFREGMK